MPGIGFNFSLTSFNLTLTPLLILCLIFVLSILMKETDSRLKRDFFMLRQPANQGAAFIRWLI